MDLKSQLIRLGKERSELRDHIRPVLDHLKTAHYGDSSLEEVAAIAVFNAEMIPDPRRGGQTDVYAVPLDDIEKLREVLRDRGRRASRKSSDYGGISLGEFQQGLHERYRRGGDWFELVEYDDQHGVTVVKARAYDDPEPYEERVLRYTLFDDGRIKVDMSNDLGRTIKKFFDGHIDDGIPSVKHFVESVENDMLRELGII